jgi:hypothetical protein
MTVAEKGVKSRKGTRRLCRKPWTGPYHKAWTFLCLVSVFEEGGSGGTGVPGSTETSRAKTAVPDISRFCQVLDLRGSSGSRGQHDMPGNPAHGATSQENGTGLSPRSDQACACPGFPSWNMDEAGHWGAGFSCFRRGENQSLISQQSAHDRSFLQSPPDLFPALVF